ncbi:YneF family protein [Caldalkalibacillus mannanilyticus]|uniref:YneF family protein n=1 Tax=Caldalkalibacillus mannanilyticus TaxID=1418 RepID=UPI000468B480|nr:YneF family protein [Caldalkalibacillus mannanilyticus]
MLAYIIPIVTLILGIAIGFAAGVYYLKNQMTKMQADPAMIQKMAKQMGYNVNSKQINQMKNMMKKMK